MALEKKSKSFLAAGQTVFQVFTSLLPDSNFRGTASESSETTL